MKRKALHVTLDVHEPSEVELTLAERVQLDRVGRTPRTRIGERVGALLHPGVTRLVLHQGQYFFKTLSGGHLKVVYGGIDIIQDSKDREMPSEPRVVAKGDDAAGEPPALTIDPRP